MSDIHTGIRRTSNTGHHKPIANPHSRDDTRSDIKVVQAAVLQAHFEDTVCKNPGNFYIHPEGYQFGVTEALVRHADGATIDALPLRERIYRNFIFGKFYKIELQRNLGGEYDR